MDRFPDEIRRQIFQFDRTKIENWDKIVHQLKFVVVLNQFEFRANRYAYEEFEDWYQEYLGHLDYFSRFSFPSWFLREKAWMRFCMNFLNRRKSRLPLNSDLEFWI